MSEASGSRDRHRDEDKPRKRSSFKLQISRKKKIAAAKKTSRISIAGGECDDGAMAKTSWEPPFKDRKARPGSCKRERWLLTRKTWRYMADAGRKLMPDGAQGNRPEDVPKIEAYFQGVCQKEPKFLLWRKQSYPGALGFRSRGRRPRGGVRGLQKLGSVRETGSCSADEAETSAAVAGNKVPSVSFMAHPRPAGRYELERLRKDFLFGGPDCGGGGDGGGISGRSDLAQFVNENAGHAAEETLLSTSSSSSLQQQQYQQQELPLDHEELLEKLEDYIARTSCCGRDDAARSSGAAAAAVDCGGGGGKKSLRTNILESDNTQKNLLETLRRYYARSTNREKVIGDILIDRKLLENLYFELRKTRGFLGRRVIGSAASGLAGLNGGSANALPGCAAWKDNPRTLLYDLHPRSNAPTSSDYDYHANAYGDKNKKKPFLSDGKPYHHHHHFLSPPPVIEIEDVERERADAGVQTVPIDPALMGLIEDENRRKTCDPAADAVDPSGKISAKCSSGMQRRTSVENDDVSPSVSDTIKRYLRMARKKSVESDKADRFKRVNYDRNIRNIKGKGEPDICECDDTDKSVQTDDSWLSVLKTIDENYSSSRITSSRSSIDTGTTCSGEELLSPPLSPTKFLNAPGMQKSRSSTNVQQGFMSKRIWKGRSKSQTRTNAVTSPWTPLGNCLWLHASGKSVLLKDLTLLELTDLEKEALSAVSLNKLQEINLGTPVKIPTGNVLTTGPKKRRPYLLKRRANTTGNLKDKDENESPYPKAIFGISLNDCVENEGLLRSHLKVPTEVQYVPKSPRARSSFSSYIEVPKDLSERSHSCDSAASTPVSELIKTFTTSSSDILTDENDSEIVKLIKNGVPSFVTACLAYLEKYGLHKVGVFRISSSKKRLRQLREDFDHGKTLEETLSDSEDHVHEVATLLKEYFRALPDALLCNDLYQCFIQTQKIRNRHLQLDAIKHLVQLLPVVNRNTLHALLRFLSILSKFSENTKDSHGHLIEGNKMDASNLATLFAPNILHKPIKELSSNDLSDEMTIERRYAIDVITTLIVNYEYLFKVPAELLDEVYINMLDTNPSGLDNVMRLRFSNVEKTFQTNQESRENNLLNVPSAPNAERESPKWSDGSDKKIWIRGEFTHQNSGIGVSDDNEENGKYKNSRPRERETRRSRSKVTAAFFPDDVEAFTYPVFERMQMNKKPEKFSNSQINSNGNQVNDGIITASLMIPVPVKQQQNTSYPLNVEYTDIPYIEDESVRQASGSAAANYHRVLAKVSSDSSSAVSTPPTSPDHVTGTTMPDQTYRGGSSSSSRKTAAFKSADPQKSQKDHPFKDAEPDHCKAEKKSKEKDVKFYQKILSSTGLDRLSKSASSTGVPKTPVSKEKMKHGHDESALLPAELQPPANAQLQLQSFGGAVSRSKTADIEQLLRKQAAAKPRKVSQSSEPSSASRTEKPRRKTSADAAQVRHPSRIVDSDPHVGERLASGPSYRSASPAKNVWRRKDVISSLPKH